MKYGILGGTFDPPHLGHLDIARAALETLGLDEIIWIPAYRNPLKQGVTTDAQKRFHMCTLAVENEPNMSASNIEVTRKGYSYLIETLSELKLVMPGEYWFIAGSDTFSGIKDWKDHEEIFVQCRLAMISRPGIDLPTVTYRLGKEVMSHIDMIETTPMTISSSNIRDRAFKGEDVSNDLAPAVNDYIIKSGLYKN